jgi:hypothetical protein
VSMPDPDRVYPEHEAVHAGHAEHERQNGRGVQQEAEQSGGIEGKIFIYWSWGRWAGGASGRYGSFALIHPRCEAASGGTKLGTGAMSPHAQNPGRRVGR